MISNKKLLKRWLPCEVQQTDWRLCTWKYTRYRRYDIRPNLWLCYIMYRNGNHRFLIAASENNIEKLRKKLKRNATEVTTTVF